jgi:O-antigen/teichoic acid export membrane protein
LKTTGYAVTENSDVDYGLLKSLLLSMKTFYSTMALIFVLIFAVASPFYLSRILKEYTGDHQSVWIAWCIFGVILAYELYTYYYNAILTGRGKIKQNMKITVLSQSIRIVLTIVLLLCGLKLLALVIGVFAADIVNRTLAHKVFYDKKLKMELSAVKSSKPVMETIKILAPNSIKIGLSMCGNFLRSKMPLYIAPYFLPLAVIGSYGVTMQITSMIFQLGGTWFGTFYPQLAQYTVQDRNTDVKRMYIKALFFLLVIYIVLGSGFVLFGQDILTLIKSQTHLLSGGYIIVILLFSLLDMNQGIATSLLTARNEVPYYKSYIVAGVLTVLLLWLMLHFTSLGVWALILSSGIAMSVYIFWKWTYEVIKKLDLTTHDISQTIKTMWEENKHFFDRR